MILFGSDVTSHDPSGMLTCMSITLLGNIISHSSTQAVYVLSRGYVSAQAVVSLVVPRQPSVHPLLRPVRLEYRHLLEAHLRMVALASTIASDITVLHLHHVRSWRCLHNYASSLYHDDSCLSPRHVHLVSKVLGRPLGGVYQALSFDAAYFHTVPSLHLENVTTVDPAMVVQPERSFEVSAPSVAQLESSHCSRELTCAREVFHTGPRSSSEYTLRRKPNLFFR